MKNGSYNCDPSGKERCSSQVWDFDVRSSRGHRQVYNLREATPFCLLGLFNLESLGGVVPVLTAVKLLMHEGM